jgi:putative transcriptional regulator
VLKRSAIGRVLFALGYAGWSAGQLDSELEEGAWIPAPLGRRILFEVPFPDRWKQAWMSLGVDPNLWAMTPGDG